MKKLVLSLAAVAMFASCSNEEIIEQAERSAIGFDAFVNKSTRTTDTTKENIGSIEVNGWRTKGETDVQIFSAQEVTVASNGVGTYTPVQYWEKGYTYNFEAVAPTSNENKGVAFTGAKSGGTINFTSDATTDLVYAKTAEVNATEGYNTSVKFTFKHLLSRVMFTFVNAFRENAAAKLTVTDVKIIGAYTDGAITNPAENEWDVNEEDKNAEIIFNSDNVLGLFPQGSKNSEGTTLTYTAVTEHMFLIPNSELTEYTVEFKVELDQNGAKTVYNKKTTIEIAFEKASSYNFTATLDEDNTADEALNAINFTADVNGWGESWTPENTGSITKK